MLKIYNGAGLILRQYSMVQLSPVKIPVLVRLKYFKRWMSHTCILRFYFSTESKQMFLLELRLKFNKYFKVVFHLKQQSCPPPQLHSFIPIPTKPFLYTSTFVCWSVQCAAVQLDSAEKQPKKRRKKKKYFQDRVLFLSGLLCSCTNTIVHIKKSNLASDGNASLQIWLICSLTVLRL